MRGRDVAIIVICVALAGGLFYASGAQLDYINAQREKMGLVINPALENAPPSLAFATVAMGAFRGLVVDILWMRADKLKEEGQFFDAEQLAEWITTLQPRFAAVWEFHAWNMAYNISVAIPATQPDQRWRWVKNGYELLRDKGIPMNPKSIALYRELARIFQHKLGDVSDDVHKYYKLQLAEAMGPLLVSQDNGLTWENSAYFDALVQTPQQWSQIAADANVAPLIEALRKADETFTSDEAFVQAYLSLRQAPGRFKPAALDVIDIYRGTPALKRLDLFAKAFQLRHTWKLEPARMRELNRTYGPIDFADPNRHYPLDWRHPDSHAIYWATKGLSVATDIQDPDLKLVKTNTERIVAHSLQNLFRYGKIVILQGRADPPPGADTTDEATVWQRRDIFLGPDLRMFDPYNEALLNILAGYTDRGTLESLQNGHRNMLRNAVLSFYQAGLKGEALKIYRELRQRYPRPEFEVPLEQYALARFREELESIGIHDAREQVVALLTDGYRLYAIGDDQGAAGREELAKQAYNFYLASNPDEFRVDLPPLRELKYIALNTLLYSGAYPVYIQERLLARIQTEKPELYEELMQAEKDLLKRQQGSAPNP
ncbi:MAG: hypothetical protein JW993_18615 [Sedimentisphaerales bacterium]|nr:hypothetical protein [Sedimentisphaerales bacterium]